jgi:hypothetical protein
MALQPLRWIQILAEVDTALGVLMLLCQGDQYLNADARSAYR